MILSWDNIIKLIKTDYVFLRSPFVEENYQTYLTKLKASGETTDSYINRKLFSIPSNHKYCLTVNSFPYLIENDVYHYVFWINPTDSLSTYEVATVIKHVLGDAVYKENPLEIRSVKTIVHYQVFSRTPPEEILDNCLLELVPDF